jgi:hypothetical protein
MAMAPMTFLRRRRVALPAEPDGVLLDRAERAAWSLVWLTLVVESFEIGHFWSTTPLAVILGIVMTLGGVAGLAATWLVRSPRNRVMQACAFVGVIFGVLFPASFVIHGRVVYGTDSAAFDHVGARALMAGHNPFAISFASAAHLLPDPALYWTYTVTGGHVLSASYPAGSFLVEVPALWFGLTHQVVDWTDLSCWVITAILLFVLLPARLRWMAALLSLTPIYIGTYLSGGTDAAFLPLLVLAAWRWDRFGVRGAGISRWMGPAALGLACSIKQTPWFFVPILAIGIAMEAHRRRETPRRIVLVAGGYLALVVVAFAVVNLPFLVWQPHDWFHAVTLPFFGGLVADGQGIVAIATHGFSGGVSLSLLSAASLVAYVAFVGAFVAWYSELKRVWLFVLPAVFAIAPRSLSTYLVDLVPVAVVAAVSVAAVGVAAVGAPAAGETPALGAPAAGEMPARSDRRRNVGSGVGGPSGLGAVLRALGAFGLARSLRYGVAMLLVAVALLSTLAFTVRPMHVMVDRVRPTRHGYGIATLTVTVSNSTSGVERPYFTVNTGPGVDGYWRVDGNRKAVVPPHRSVTFRLRPPGRFAALPTPGSHWIVEVYTASPNALTTTPMLSWAGTKAQLRSRRHP